MNRHHHIGRGFAFGRRRVFHWAASMVSLAACCCIGLAGGTQTGIPLGAANFYPSPEHPVGWLGDLSARYPGARDFPLEWDSTTPSTGSEQAGKNILWKTELPGWGFSSPIVVGKPSAGSGQGRVFLTCEIDTTVCLDAETGAILWQKAAGGTVTKGSGIYHCSTGYSMGTACSDGRNLFVTHYNGEVISYDFEGNVRWRHDVPPLGWNGSSPVLIDGMFVVVQGVKKTDKIALHGPYDVVAYACEDGKVLWRTTGVLRMNGWHYNGLIPVWVEGAPYLFNWSGQFFNARTGAPIAQLIRSGPSVWVPAAEGDTVVLAYSVPDPTDWRSGLQDLAKVEFPAPAGMEEAMRREASFLVDNIPRGKRKGWHAQFDWLVVPLKVSSDGKGGLRFEPKHRPVLVLGNGEFPHMVLADGFLYFMGDGNHARPTVTVIELATGRAVSQGGYDGWEIKPQRPATGGIFGGSSFFYPHAVTADDYFMLSDWGGRTYVFNRAPDLRLITANLTTIFKRPPSGNPIGGPAGGQESSEFYQGNRIYLRHFDVLYCIGDPKAAEHAAAFAAAKAHVDGGRIPQALQAYHQLWNAEPLHVRYRAVREMGALLGAQALDELTQAFRHQDVNLRALAVSVAARTPGDGVARRLAEGLNDGNPAYRCQVLESLGQRGDRSASPQLAAALDDKAAEVRLAAIGAVKRVGGTVAVQGVVARLERLSEPERAAATAALIVMPEPDTEKSLAEQVSQASPLTRSILVRVLGSRGAVTQTALMLGETAHADRSVRLAALGALAMVAGTQELDSIVARMKHAKDEDERRAIGSALLCIFSRTRAIDAYTAAVLRGLGSVEGEGYASLIRALGPSGGKASLTEVRTALGSKDAAIHAAAIEAMAVWPDTAAEPDLMAVAKTERNPTNRAEVVRGLLRMLDLSPKRPAGEVFAIYSQALKTGAALGSIVAHLGTQKDLRAIEMAAGLLERKELEEAIVNTITTVAPGAAEKDAAKTIAVLTKATEEVKDQRQRERMNGTIKDLVGKYGSKAIDISADDGIDL